MSTVILLAFTFFYVRAVGTVLFVLAPPESRTIIFDYIWTQKLSKVLSPMTQNEAVLGLNTQVGLMPQPVLASRSFAASQVLCSRALFLKWML